MGTEVIRFTQLGEQDLRFGTGTFEVTLADGRKVVLDEIDIGTILSDATKSTRVVTLDTLTVSTLNFSGTLSGAALTISGAATFGSLSTASATITSTPTARTHALTVGNVQDGLGVYVATVGGTADAITLTPSPAITAYAAGQTFRFIAASTNTTAVTVAISGLTAQAVTKNGTTALIAGDLPQSAMVEITYDGTRFIIGTLGAATGAAGAISASIIDAKGDLIVGTAADTAARQAVGSDGTLLMARSGVTNGIAYVAALNKYIYGLTYSNGTDATNDIDFAAGGCMDSTGAFFITCAAMAGKQLDVNWAPGAAAGMRNSGAAITDTDYYLYAVAKADGTQDYYAHTSTTVATVITALQAETGGADYLYARIIGYIQRASSTIVAHDTYETEGGGLEFLWDAPTVDVNLANTLTTSRRTDAVKVPLNFSVIARLDILALDVAGETAIVYCPDQADVAPSIGSSVSNTGRADANVAYEHLIRTSTTGTVAARATVATINTYAIRTIGFTWARRN